MLPCLTWLQASSRCHFTSFGGTNMHKAHIAPCTAFFVLLLPELHQRYSFCPCIPALIVYWKKWRILSIWHSNASMACTNMLHLRALHAHIVSVLLTERKPIPDTIYGAQSAAYWCCNIKRAGLLLVLLATHCLQLTCTPFRGCKPDDKAASCVHACQHK